MGPDNRGCATLATPFGTFYTRFALGGLTSGIATQGRIIEFEGANPTAYIAAGPMARQNPRHFLPVSPEVTTCRLRIGPRHLRPLCLCRSRGRLRQQIQFARRGL